VVVHRTGPIVEERLDVDFEFDSRERAFREEVRAFLEEELPAWWRTMFADDDRVIPLTREICQKLAARGWLTMTWPEEYGGSDGATWDQVIIREEMWAHGEPRGPQYMNLNYIGPMIMRFGTPEQRGRFLKPMAAGTVIWTQGFSEPEAGSDLASLRTAARQVEGGFVIDGQKIWNSYADAPADWCLLLARTDPEAPKHRGISVFLVDMRTAGITVRPIDSMGGPRDINEIFFDEVFVPRDCLLGDLNNGWPMVMTGLTFERVGIARYARAARIIEILVEYVRSELAGAGEPEIDFEMRQQLADLYCRCEAARLVNYHAMSQRANGQVQSAEASLARIHNTLLEQHVAQVGMQVLGMSAQLTQDDPGAPLGGLLVDEWLHNIPATIEGGSLEIQKAIISQRGLGLPRSR
jgi:alkylation response protein AidB-like acyl-CoA dehydrogenase